MNPRAISLPSNNSLQQLKIENIGMNFTSLEFFLELNNLTLLSDLDLSGNALKQIGNLTKNLPNLQELDVTGNPYTPCDCETFLNLEYMNKVMYSLSKWSNYQYSIRKILVMSQIESIQYP